MQTGRLTKKIIKQNAEIMTQGTHNTNQLKAAGKRQAYCIFVSVIGNLVNLTTFKIT